MVCAAAPAVVAAAPRLRAPKKFPPEYKRMTPAKRLIWLVGEECKSLIKSGRLQKNQVNAEVSRIEKARVQIRNIGPNPDVADEWLNTGQPFPPPAEHTPMRRPAEGQAVRPEELRQYFPGYYFTSSRHLYEKYLAALYARPEKPSRSRRSTTESVTGKAMEELADRQGTIRYQVDLLPEDVESLKAEIAERSEKYRRLMGDGTVMIRLQSNTEESQVAP